MLIMNSAVAEHTVTTRVLTLQFNERGDLIQAEACFPDCQTNRSKQRVFSSSKGVLVFNQPDMPRLNFQESTENALTIVRFFDAQSKILRQWEIPDEGWLVSVTSWGGTSASLAVDRTFLPQDISGFGYLLEQARYLIETKSGFKILGLDADDTDLTETEGWFGFRNRYWTAMMIAGSSRVINIAAGDSDQSPSITIPLIPGSQELMKLYIGPVEPTALGQSDPVLEQIMYSGIWGWLRWLSKGLFLLLISIAALIPSWGLSVIVLSVFVALLMYPLSKYSDRLQQQVQEIDARLAPGLVAIKEQYSGARQSEEIISLYKKNAVHPLYSLKGLFGLILIIPVFIAVFNMLAENIHLSGESFLWIKDLSQVDSFVSLPFMVPFFGSQLNLLPFIMAGLSYFASSRRKLTGMDLTAQRKQQRNLLLMTLSFFVLFYTFPAGMVLYWATSNFISVIISVIKELWKLHKESAQVKKV